MKRILCPLLAAALLSGGAFAQTAPQPIVTPVMQKDLADLPGREMLMLSVEYPPGTVEHIHRRDAYAFVYVRCAHGRAQRERDEAREVHCGAGEEEGRRRGAAR